MLTISTVSTQTTILVLVLCSSNLRYYYVRPLNAFLLNCATLHSPKFVIKERFEYISNGELFSLNKNARLDNK